MTISTAYEGFTEFKIGDIEYEDDAEEGANPIEFRYAAPSVAVDTSGRFVTHEIIGGSTVRQKVGEEPIEVSVKGVCTEDTAVDIDGLRDAKNGTIYSDRLRGGSLDVQFASASTSPLEDGGAVSLSDDDKFLYTFQLECVEVTI